MVTKFDVSGIVEINYVNKLLSILTLTLSIVIFLA